ncbi:DUF2846 domain-containing protein [Lysobacter auxotrophicus]|uniref:DUF2846 domain-containing protein n=1 Tax=Lysobacter auxotrophicus TaxID=2992573 RepID=A0ABN6UNP1_9GAMM|nr:DUF2846 domain-containing protein [Lysobacter auxotrophicus]BDU17989.1 DUF2846 domain-containing protein [Lysobacter auxotrophicus]
MRSMLSRTAVLSLLLAPAFAIANEGDAASATSAAASASAASTNTLINAAPADKAQIVFFRESKFVGGAIGFKVREGDTELGKLRSGKYFVANVEPGKHEYNVHGETKDVLTMEVEAGETYYVLGSLGMGIVAGRPNLSPSDEATFLSMSDKLKLAK